MSAKLTGSRELSQAFGRIKAAVRGRILAEAAQLGGNEVAADARRLAPRDTGKGAESIRAEVSSVTADKASVDVSWTERRFYMKFQEFGTRFHSAKPFLRPAFDSRNGHIWDVGPGSIVSS